MTKLIKAVAKRATMPTHDTHHLLEQVLDLRKRRETTAENESSRSQYSASRPCNDKALPHFQTTHERCKLLRVGGRRNVALSCRALSGLQRGRDA